MKTKIFLIATFLFVSLASAQAQRIVRVKPAKPKVVVVKTKRPSARHFWIDGHWKWNKRQQRYVWVKGHWSRPKTGYVWVAGHWTRRPNGYIWVEGYWRRRVA